MGIVRSSIPADESRNSFMADASQPPKRDQSFGARIRPYVLPVVSTLMAGISNVINQKYGTLVSDWLILLIFYMAVGLWFYWAWHTERIGRLRAWLLYTYPRMFLIVLIVGGAIVGAAAGVGLWVANRNEQRMRAAARPPEEPSSRLSAPVSAHTTQPEPKSASPIHVPTATPPPAAPLPSPVASA